MSKIAKLTVQKWGNSLAIRIPSAIAKSAKFSVGQPIEIVAADSGVIVTPVGEPKLTLAQKLALFDPEKHSGEAMATGRLGAEAF
jgi:antitoxin MazE